MIAGKIDGEGFNINWKKGKAQIETHHEWIRYIASISRRVLVYDPYMCTMRYADILKNGYDAWLILNQLYNENAIKLELSKTDILYE